MSPNDPEPILRPSLYLFPTRSSMVVLLNGFGSIPIYRRDNSWYLILVYCFFVMLNCKIFWYFLSTAHKLLFNNAILDSLTWQYICWKILTAHMNRLLCQFQTAWDGEPVHLLDNFDINRNSEPFEMWIIHKKMRNSLDKKWVT